MAYCCKCGCLMEEGWLYCYCSKCDSRVLPEAHAISTNPPVSHPAPKAEIRLKLVIALSALLVLAAIVIASLPDEVGPKRVDGGSLTQPTATPSNLDDAELLISRCGQPDQDESTQYDSPRPLFPTRFITYESAHLTFAYVPGHGARGDDPPPYSWKLVGITDSRTNSVVESRKLRQVLSQRLPCDLP